MKKTLSVFLALLMAFTCIYPVFAAEGDTNVPETGEGETGTKYSVTFQSPVRLEADAYMYVKTINGEMQFEEDPDGEYVFFDNRYMLPSNIYDRYHDQIPPERYSPVQYSGTVEIAEGETLTFKILTSEKYNVLTATVFVNGSPAAINAHDEYAIYVDRDLIISVAEFDETTGAEALLRNHFHVKLTSGDGYKVKTLKGQNYEVTYYGDSFEFRVKVDKGYSAAGIKVSVQRGKSSLDGFLGEEDSDMLAGIIGKAEPLTSYGIDEDGCRLYKIENITTDCKVIVSGIQEESSVGIFAFLKRILRLLLDIFGIKLDILDSITAYYTVTIDAAEADGVTYQVIRSTEDELSPSEFTVTSGDGITVVVTKKDPTQDVSVMWTPGNELGTYKTDWILDYNTVTGEVTYVAVYNIDNITADTTIVIS